jgi:transcriptional regulator with XRE-family HTH domain
MTERHVDFSAPRANSKQRRAKRTPIERVLARVAHRLARLWTQAQLAERAGLAFDHICRIETGTGRCSYDALERVAEAFGVRGSDLLALAEAQLASASALRRVS